MDFRWLLQSQDVERYVLEPLAEWQTEYARLEVCLPEALPHIFSHQLLAGFVTRLLR